MSVTCDWAGRLGNNMFQAATVLAYAHKHNVEPVFQEHEHFVLQNKSMQIKNFYHEPCHAYREIPFIQDVCLVGYYQSEKYFKDIKGILQDYFLDSEFPIGDYIAIHVRRGDYLNYPDKHPTPSLKNYYYKAMELFKNRKFLIFSDDKRYCENHFNFWDEQFSWELYPDLNDYEYLQLMASCKDFIIANSSYSWWGAWLSRNEDKKIICPSYGNWFGKGNANLYPNDIIPEDWIQIEY